MLATLVENAIIYNRPGGRVDVQVAPAADGSATVVVADTGRGIPAEELDRIFDRFHRVARDVPGTGLGLAIVIELASSIGASVRVSSEVGRGSRFEVRFPPSPGAAKTDEAAAAGGPLPGGEPRP
jgi:signal transduction histidine kinase